MKNTLRIMLSACLGVALLVAPIAASSAEDDAKKENTEKKKAVEKKPDRRERVSDKVKPERAERMVSRLKVILSKVLGHLKEAREDRDVVKLNCVNEKLSAVKGLLRISERADVTLQEAIARGDTDVSDHEFEKISIAFRKCEQLLAESESCIGGLAVYSEDFDLKVLFDDTDFESFEEYILKHYPPSENPPASPFQ